MGIPLLLVTFCDSGVKELIEKNKDYRLITLQGISPARELDLK